jgi:hypothetical protein
VLYVRPQDTPTRLRRVGVGVLVAGLLMIGAGCSGGGANGADEPSPSLTLGAGSGSPSADPAVDEAALRRLFKTYEKVDAEADQAGNTDPSVYEGLLSRDYAELLVDNMKKYILADGLHVLGRYHYRVDDVDVDGDQATLQVCADGHEFFVVPKAQKTLGTGDTGQPTVLSTYTAVRTADGWVLTGSDTKDKRC